PERIEGRADFPVDLLGGRLQRRRGGGGTSGPGGGNLGLRQRNAAKEEVLAATKAHAVAPAGLGRQAGTPHLVDVGSAEEERRVDLGDRDLARPRRRGGRAVEGRDTQHVRPCGRLVFGRGQIVEVQAGGGAHRPSNRRAQSLGFESSLLEVTASLVFSAPCCTLLPTVLALWATALPAFFESSLTVSGAGAVFSAMSCPTFLEVSAISCPTFRDASAIAWPAVFASSLIVSLTPGLWFS